MIHHFTMKKIILFVVGNLLFLNKQVAFAHHKDNPVVKTPLGDIKGSISTTVLGKDIFSFRGIRYAKAPVDELRFQPPVPVEKWNDVYDATEDGPICPQPRQKNTSEDCLMLNVYTTLLPHEHQTVKRPVLVFIHPGGFYSSGGTKNRYGPDYMLDQDFVLVVINYRLASLGFMSTGDELAPGNNGLKDQVVALRWIQANIASFGGDPNSVTISGYSAGGASVTLHMVSPMSKGLFHRVIAMSGTGFGNWPTLTHQFDMAQKQARFLNCPDDNSTVIMQCLNTKSGKEIGDTLSQFDEFAYDPIWMWLPVIEPNYGQERFLTEDPVESVRKGDFVKVPVMTGITTLEFYYTAENIFENESWVKAMDEEFERVAPIAFVYERGTEKSRNVSRELRKAYLDNKPITKESLPGLGKLYADGVIGFGVDRTAKLLAIKNDCPTYYYKFSYEGQYSYHRNKNNETEGVVHHDDLLYLFYIAYFPKLTKKDSDYRIVRRMTKIFHNFAVEGKPILEATPDFDNIIWDPIVPGDTAHYMDIGKKLEMKTNLYADRYAVWEKFYPVLE